MTYSLSNNCTKNYYNRTLTVQVIVEDVVTWIFLKHSVVYAGDKRKRHSEMKTRYSETVIALCNNNAE